MRIVPDTNILVSGLISRTGYPSQILTLWRSNVLRFATSEPILAEYHEVLHREKIRRLTGLNPSQIQELMGLLRSASRMTSGIILPTISPDPKDNMFLGCAVEAQAAVVTGDKEHLLNLKTYQGIEIISAKECIERAKSLQKAA